MGEEKVNKFKLTILLVATILSSGICINMGDDLVSKARQYWGRPYLSSGGPSNATKTGRLLDGYYQYGLYWGSDDGTWDGKSEWTGGFDCSGLVSYCANLKRRYTTDQLPNFFSSPKSWESANVGDLIHWYGNPGHVSIFIDRSIDESNNGTIHVIHATSYTTKQGIIVHDVREEDYPQDYYDLNGASIYAFKEDNEDPLISLKEGANDLIDGKTYDRDIKISYSAQDNTNEPDGEQTYIKGNYQKGYSFSKNGTYGLKIYAEDWARNLCEKSIGFTIKKPYDFSITVSPPINTVKIGTSASHKITINNLDPANAETFDVRLNPIGDGWSWSATEFLSVPVAAKSPYIFNFNVTNNNATTPLKTSINVTEKTSDVLKTAKCTDVSGGPPNNDQPDESQSIASTSFPTPWLFDPDAKIGVLAGGWGEGLNCLLGKFKIATTVVDEDLKILGTSENDLSNLNVLCIGSGGLDVFESSPAFRQKLVDFVNGGGRLIVLTTQNGSTWSALPGGQVGGFGWVEDMSCFNAAVYIDTYHQILSSLTGTYADVNVDGYFTKWPDSAKVLLRTGALFTCVKVKKIPCATVPRTVSSS